MNRKALFSISWIVLGNFFILIGRDIFLLIPKFRFENIMISARSQILFAYIILASYFWIRGWSYGLQNRFTFPGFLVSSVRRVQRFPPWLRWSLAVSLVLLPTILLFFTPLSHGKIGMWLRAIPILTAALGVSFLVKPQATLAEWLYTYTFSILAVGVVFYAEGILIGVTPYPFSLTWSEGNRLWDYSIKFGSDRYIFPGGEEIFALISPGREMLMGLPYLIPNISILGVRLWVALVQILMPVMLGSLLIAGNQNMKKVRKDVLLFAAWAFVFLLQGPIQPRLIVSAIIMVLGVRNKNLTVAIILVMLAGYWANISRWSWAYAPGLWAGMLALLREDTPSLRREDWGKLKRPISLGLAGYFGGQILTALIRVPSNTFVDTGEGLLLISAVNQTAFSQTLLWDRLLPNPTFSSGILLALLSVLLPIVVWSGLAYKKGKWRPNRLQVLGVSFPLVAFLAVGVIASTKIGGGADLHNTDMFLIGVLILAAFAWPHALRYLRGESTPLFFTILGYGALVMPVFYSISSPSPLVVSDNEYVYASLKVIQEEVDKAKGFGEVLFLDQRQLLTFGYIEGVPLVADYEKKYLMDQAMAGKAAYFDSFYDDIANHRFSLIVSEPLFLKTGNANKSFSEENDVWVTWVSQPLLRYYRVLVEFKALRIQLLVPREQ